MSGLSHLADDGSCEGVGPSGSFPLALDGDAGSGGLEHVEGELAHDGAVFGAVIFAGAGAVLVEGGVEHPVEPVLDGPMGAHRPGRSARA